MKATYIFLLILIVIISGLGGAIYLFQQPFKQADIPRWKVRETKNGVWHLFSVEEPSRQTTAWFEGNPDQARCDTIVIMGGLEEGRNLAVGAAHLPQRANIVALRHPINQFFEASPWEEWAWWEWLLQYLDTRR